MGITDITHIIHISQEYHITNTIDMAKKQFTSNFNDIFSPTVEQPKQADSKPIRETENRSTSDVQRTTLLLSRSIYNDIRAIAHWERCQIKELLEEALKLTINSYAPEELSRIRKEFSHRQGSR